jgi:hypothetical protein
VRVELKEHRDDIRSGDLDGLKRRVMPPAPQVHNETPGGGTTMAKPRKAGGRAVRMSPLTIARIEAELLTLAAELKARVPDMTPVTLQALKKRLRRAMGLIR